MTGGGGGDSVESSAASQSHKTARSTICSVNYGLAWLTAVIDTNARATVESSLIRDSMLILIFSPECSAISSWRVLQK